MMIENPRHETAILGGAGLLSGGIALALASTPSLRLVAAGALCVAVLVVAFAMRPHWAAPAVLIGFAIQPALKTFVSPNVGPAKDVIVIAVFVAVVAARVARRARPQPAVEPDAWLVAAVLVFLALYIVNPAGVHDAAWAQGTRLVVESFALFLAGYLADETKRTWVWAQASLIIAGLLNAVVGTWQQSVGSIDLVLDYGYTWGAQVRETATGQFRSFGTLDDPFNYAAVLLLALVVVIFGTRRRGPAAIAGVILLAAIAESYVRTAIFIVAVLAALVLIRHRRGVSAGALASALVIGAGAWLLVTPQGTGDSPTGLAFITTVNGRTSTWSEVIRGPFDLVAGRGAGSIGSGAARAQFGTIITDADRDRQTTTPTPTVEHIDSSYFATVADVGIAGLAVLIAIGLRAMTLAGQAARRGSPAAWAAIALGCVLTFDALSRSSLTSFPFGFIGLYALGLALARARAEASGADAGERGAWAPGLGAPARHA